MKLNFFKKNKFTYFDLFLGVIFLLIFVGVYLFFYRKNEYVNIRVRVTDQDVLYANTNPKSWYANRFEVGDKELNELGTVTSEIVNVETFNISGDSKAVYLDVKIKAVYDRRTKLYSAKGSSLVFGNTIKFNFANAAFYGLITESPSTINQQSLTIETKRVTLLQRGGWEPEILQKIKKGDKIIDSNNNVLVNIVEVTLSPAQHITQNTQGDLLLRYDPYYKDARIIADVRIKKYKGDEFAFDTLPLKLGASIPLNFNYETIWPTIIDIR